MRKLVLPFFMLIALSAIYGFQWKDRHKKVKYHLEITSLNEQETTFNASVLLGGESIRLNNQNTPYVTIIEASDLECLIDASDQIKIVMTSKNGKLESNLQSAYIKADGVKKRILGM